VSRRRGALRALALVALLTGGAARADALCPDAGLLSGKLLTDVCWGCLFPIRIAGLAIGTGAVPRGASEDVFCSCNDGLGVPHPGLVTGLWQPARVIELTHVPGCAPALGGMRLPFGSERLIGTTGQSEQDSSDVAFAHYHAYAFPLLALLDLFVEDRCTSDGYLDFDILYLSELDPTWSVSELAFFTHPETALLASPAALAACMADAVAATAGEPIDPLFWCAGTWGGLYPLAGVDGAYGSRPRHTSLLAARAMAALHRRGLAWRTMGNDVLCGSRIEPFLPKRQYRLSMFYPSPEANSTHVIGESTFRWGEWRSRPGPGAHHLYLLWRWQDCCLTF
jgi:conjugal transfer pilus assembly protein TraU